jgi:tetratricopeptide (TPR) repeat protein
MVKKIINILALLLIGTLYCNAQNSFLHVVQRGENFESIAKQYNVSVNALKEANPDEDECFVGYELTIPAVEKKTVGAIVESNSVEYAVKANSVVEGSYDRARLVAQQFQRASQFMSDGKYSKATKVFDAIIQTEPSSLSYLGRGMSYYRRGKYASAVKDFKVALSKGELDTESTISCEKIMESAKQLRDEKRERTGGIIAAVVGAAAITTASVYAAHESKSLSSTPSYNYGSMSDAQFSDYLNVNFANIMAQTQQQFALQQQMEYQSDAMQYKQMTGKDLSYMEWMAMKGAAIQEAQASGYDILGTSINSDEESHKYKPSPPSPAPSSSCSMCHGTGRIGKELYPPSYGMPDNTKVRCNECGEYHLKSSGHTHVPCPVCHGRK